jgi:LysM repeat protein
LVVASQSAVTTPSSHVALVSNDSASSNTQLFHPHFYTTPLRKYAPAAITDYVVKAGDTLSGISQKLFGNPDKWPWLYASNERVIGQNPNLIEPGQELKATLASHPAYGAAVNAVNRARQTLAAYQSAVQNPPGYSATSSPYNQAVSTAGDGSFQACVIARESGGQSQVMNSTGHYGLYQFSASTWAAYGGSPADFGHASVAEQNRVFGNAMARGGEDNWRPYDGC